MQVAWSAQAIWQRHTIYTRMSRWAKSGVLDRAFEQLQQAQVVQIKIEAVSLDSTSIKVHPDGTGLENGPQAIGKSRGGWNTKIHLIAADARTAVTFSLSPGQAHDAVECSCAARATGAAQSASAPSDGSRLRGQ